MRRIGGGGTTGNHQGREQQGLYDCRAGGRGKHTIHSSTLKKLRQ
jgi:hypothetical protein